MALDPRDVELNEPHRVALLRLVGEEKLTVKDLAKPLVRHPRAVYRMLEGDVAGHWWVPCLVGQLAGAAAFAAVSRAADAGVICVDAPSAGRDRASDIARLALELGGDAGAVQQLVAKVTAPDSPGGRAIVGQEQLAVRAAIDELKRATASLELALEPVHEVSRR